MLEEGKISRIQLIFLIISFTGLLSFYIPIRPARHDAWLALLAGFVEGLIIVMIYLTLALRFPGKTPIEYNDIIYGAYLGKFISILQLGFFLHLGSLFLRGLADFLASSIMPETPLEVFLISIIIVCAYAVYQGIEVISRITPILVFIALITILIPVILLIKDIDFNNFLPFFDVSLGEFLRASHGAATYPFGQTVIFIMIIPFMNDYSKVKGSFVIGLVISLILLELIFIRNIGVLGMTGQISMNRCFQAVRLIDIADVLTRLDILFISNLIAIIFLKISILFYGTVLGTAQLLHLNSYLPLVLPIGIIILVLSLILFDNVVEYQHFIKEIWSLYAVPFEAGIPLLSLIIATIRRKTDLNSAKRT